MQLTHKNQLSLSESVFLCGNEGTLHVYCTESDKIFKLNSTGKTILDFLNEEKKPLSIENIISILSEKYEGVTEDDVLKFISNLNDQGIVCIS